MTSKLKSTLCWNRIFQFLKVQNWPGETKLLDERMKNIYSKSDKMLEWLPNKSEDSAQYLIKAKQLINN